MTLKRLFYYVFMLGVPISGMKKNIAIVMLGLCLIGISFAYYNIFEEKAELELHYGYAMEMAKMNLDGSTEEIKKKVFESKKLNMLI